MDRREFQSAVLGGGISAVGLLTGVGNPTAIGGAFPPAPHPGDGLPTGSNARLGTTRLWHLVERGNEGVNDLAFSPDGRTLAALGYQDGCISLWEVPGGRLLRKWDADDADRRGELVFSPCGRFLAIGSNDGLRLWDPHTGRLVRQFADSRTCVDGVAFSPDGRLLSAAVSFGGRIDVWDVATGALAARFEADPHPLWPGSWDRSDQFKCVTFSVDGLLIAAGSEYRLYHDVNGPQADALQAWLLERHRHCGSEGRGGKSYLYEPRGRLWCWELASGRRVAKLEGHEFPVRRVRFLPDGRLVSSATDGAVWKWDLAAARRVDEFAPSVNRTFETSAAFTADGRRAVLSRPGYLGLIDLTDGGEVRRFAAGATWSGWVCLAVSPNVQWIATATRGRISLWDATTGADVSPRPRHTGWVQAVRFTADGRRVVSVTTGEAILWEMPSSRVLRQFTAVDGSLRERTLALSPDGERVACVLGRYNRDPSACAVDRLVTWDWRSDEVRVWDEVNPTTLAWAPDGEAVVVGTEQGEVFVLHLRTGRRDRGPEVEGWVASVAVSPDGRLAAALGEGPAIHLWELKPGGWRKQLAIAALPCPANGNFGEPSRLSFGPDSRVLALTTGHGYVCAGPVDGTELPLVFTAPRGRDSSVGCFETAFLPDGRLRAAQGAGIDGDDGHGPYALWVWDVDSGREVLASPPQQHPVSGLAFSPNGRTLASGSWDATVLFWNIGATC